jgi:hypothetical protein
MILEEIGTIDAPISVDAAAGLLAGIGIGLGILALIGC